MMHGDYGMGTWGAWGIFGMLLHIAIVIGVIFGIVLLVQYLVRPKNHQSPSTEKSSLSILEERYARGEISDEEFKQKRRVLKE